MRVPSEKAAIRQIAERLAELVNVKWDEVKISSEYSDPQVNAVVNAGSITFIVEWKSSGAPGPVASAIKQLRYRVGNIDKDIVPLVAVPFMGDAGREQCAKADVAWLDLSGNARIYAPGLHILVEGKPNRYKRLGRPSTAFAPKSSRIARWLLMHPAQSFSQRELAIATGMGEGYTSKVVGKLEEEGFINRNDAGAVQPKDSDLMLDAWRSVYDFSKHCVIRGHIAARSGDVLLRQLVGALEQASVPYAATGLAGAWLLDRWAGFRIATLYLTEEPSPGLLDSLSFREDARGANTWLVVPNDEGVFHGAALRDDIRCVHPVQVYLDLAAHPERSEEAAQRLRAEHLNWRDND